MGEQEEESALRRGEISAAVDGLGWRFITGALHTCVPVGSLAQAADVAARVAAACPADAGGHLRVDARDDRVLLAVQSPATGWVTARDVELARQVSAAVAEAGLATAPEVGGAAPRAAQTIEIAIDALDIAAVRPFWKAVLGYVPEAGRDAPEDALVDPYGQGPAIWFQQMDAPRPQRNRIHFDVSVPHDEAPGRLRAALDAGGVLVSDAAAPAFWVLADAEGNEACICTWQGRDG